MPKSSRSSKKLPRTVKRISISLSPEAFELLEKLVDERGYDSRSQAIAELIYHADNRADSSEGEKVGTVTVFYDTSKPIASRNLTRLKRDHLDLVMSSHQVLVQRHKVMEVFLIRGSANELKTVADKLITCKGVLSGTLAVASVREDPEPEV